jgi:hypothetical protein
MRVFHLVTSVNFRIPVVTCGKRVSIVIKLPTKRVSCIGNRNTFSVLIIVDTPAFNRLLFYVIYYCLGVLGWVWNLRDWALERYLPVTLPVIRVYMKGAGHWPNGGGLSDRNATLYCSWTPRTAFFSLRYLLRKNYKGLHFRCAFLAY